MICSTTIIAKKFSMMIVSDTELITPDKRVTISLSAV